MHRTPADHRRFGISIGLLALSITWVSASQATPWVAINCPPHVATWESRQCLSRVGDFQSEVDFSLYWNQTLSRDLAEIENLSEIRGRFGLSLDLVAPSPESILFLGGLGAIEIPLFDPTDQEGYLRSLVFLAESDPRSLQIELPFLVARLSADLPLPPAIPEPGAALVLAVGTFLISQRLSRRRAA